MSKACTRPWLLTAVLTAAHLGGRIAGAGDLEQMQGVWVSEDAPWTMEVRGTTASFRGANPFSDLPACNDPHEFSLRFTLDSDASPRRFVVDDEDFDRFRDSLNLTDRASRHRYSKTLPGIYALDAPGKDGRPETMRLEFYPHDRRWPTKSFNDRAFAHLEYVPKRRLRRLCDSELRFYEKHAGVWRGELRCGELPVWIGAWMIFPGWVVFAEHGQGMMPLRLADYSQRFQFVQTTAYDQGPFGHPGGVGLFVPRSLETTWSGRYEDSAGGELVVRVRPSVPGFHPRFGVPGDSSTMSPEDYYSHPLIGGAEARFRDNTGPEEDRRYAQALADEIRRLSREALETYPLSARLTRLPQPPGESPLFGLSRVLHPELPVPAVLAGEWRVTKVETFDASLVAPRNGKGPLPPGTLPHDGYVPAALPQDEDWQIEGKTLRIVRPGSEPRAYHFHHRSQYGILTLSAPDEPALGTGFFVARVAGKGLVLTGRLPADRTAPALPSTRYTLERRSEPRP